MSKPLELTIHERDEETGDYLDPLGWTYPDEDVCEFTEQKRLTDAELAAEYHQAIGEANHLLMSPRRSGKTTAANIVDTLLRFATHPYYFEATEPESDTE